MSHIADANEQPDREYDGKSNGEGAKHTAQFNTAKDLIPMHQVEEIQNDLKCYNHRRGCKFFAKKHWCLCCMMLKTIGSDFFLYEAALQKQDPHFAFSMTDWQRDEYEAKREYWARWCDHYPGGTSG